MRPLTFKGFLKTYLQDLAGTSTTSLSRLVNLAQSENPRLREPLFLYAHASNQTDRFIKLTKGTPQFKSAAKLACLYTWPELETALEAQDSSIPSGYRKAYNSYRSKRDHNKSNEHTKALMWQRILKLKQEKEVSNYRVYKDLNLNPGNANAFLKHGDTKKLSLPTARKTLAYLESL